MKNLYIIVVLLILVVNTLSAQFSPLNITEKSKLSYTNELSDIWGYVDGNGNEYALVGVYDGFSVVDVTDPSNPSEIFFEPGAETIWRDIKVWNDYAYVTNEGDSGLLIVDLSGLPGNTNLPSTYYTGSNFPFTSAHNIYMDENGVAYIFGANFEMGGAIMLDVATDPMNPIELGVFNDFYLHDGVARGDTLWGSAINDGFTAVIDVSSKDSASINVMATFNTPHNFSHNCWFSDDGNYLYTTDEKPDAYITAYDVSDLSNIEELDRFKSSPGNDVIVHNTHFMNDYLITSYYADGVSILDVSNPSNMVDVGHFDTSPAYSGNGFNGCWGVYPWLPSGNILATDIEEGLYVLSPDYTRGCYLEGTVTESGSGTLLNNVIIEIIGADVEDSTDFTGGYAMGYHTSGTYEVKFSKAGYTSKTVSNVTLSNGTTEILNVQLDEATPFIMYGSIKDAATGNGIEGARIKMYNRFYEYDTITDASGNFTITDVYKDEYAIISGSWEYKTSCGTDTVSAAQNLEIELDSGIYDDFTFDYGWSVSGNATSAGMWNKGVPMGTNSGNQMANPEGDMTGDCGKEAYVTGSYGGDIWMFDVDNGNTMLTSPYFDLTDYNDPYINFYSWFYNGFGSGAPYNDYFHFMVSNGVDTVFLDSMNASSSMAEWVFQSFKTTDYITVSDSMQLILDVKDRDPGHIVEAGFDRFFVTESEPVGREETNTVAENREIAIYPNPFSNEITIRYRFEDNKPHQVRIYNMLGEMVDNIDLASQQGRIQWDGAPSPGIYLVTFYNGKEITEQRKVVKL